MTDNEKQLINSLIKNVADGDNKSLGELFTLCYKRLFSIAKNITRSVQGAEDVVSDTFIRVVRSAGTFKKRDNGYGWLCTIARNAALNYIKKNGYRGEKDIDECYELFDPESDPERAEEKIVLRTAFSSLDPSDRRLLYLKYYCDMTVREIAAAEGMKKSTVSYGILRAEEKLKELLK